MPIVVQCLLWHSRIVRDYIIPKQARIPNLFKSWQSTQSQSQQKEYKETTHNFSERLQKCGYLKEKRGL